MTDSEQKTKDVDAASDDHLEGRIMHVQEEQDRMRQELEEYLKEVRSRTNEEGVAVVEFPDTFDTDAQSETDRQASWRKFISDRVLTHPDEESDREIQKKMSVNFFLF